MKRVISVFLAAAVCLCLLASCTGKEARKPLSEIYASVSASDGMPEMSVMPDSLIETLFGIDLSQLEEYVFAEAAEPDINADAIILIRLKDGADKAGVIASLETYLESVKSNTQSYSPENYAKTAQSEVAEASDGTIYLIITENYSSAVSKL